MLADGPQTPYEVFCHTCRVTFPVGTKACLHCGGRLARNRVRVEVAAPPTVEDVLEEANLPRRGAGFSPTTLVWVALLIFGALYRACVGGQD